MKLPAMRSVGAIAAIVALCTALACSTAPEPQIGILVAGAAEPKPPPMYSRPIGPPEKVTPPPDLVLLGKAIGCAPVEVQPSPRFPLLPPIVHLEDGQVVLSWCREIQGDEAGTYSVLILVRSDEHPWAECSPHLALQIRDLFYPGLESDNRGPVDLSRYVDFEASMNDERVWGPNVVQTDAQFLDVEEVLHFCCHEGRWLFFSSH